MGRSPGATQGWVLGATTWLAVAAAAVVAPVSPLMASYFGGGAQIEGMVQISIGLPALFVALLGGPSGFLADRIGRKRVLLVALVLYTLFGTAPLWLPTLPLILASRAGVGMAEGAVLATGTALIGDYFTGSQRDKWFAIQGATATLIAICLLTLSGFLGAGGWRQPFAVYALPLLLVLLVARLIWEPATRQMEFAPDAKAGLPGLWRICLVTIFAAVAFYVVLVQLPFLLTDRGFGAPKEIALGTVASAVTAPLGALIFRLMARSGYASRLAVSFAASATGLGMIAANAEYVPILIGAAVNGIGSGIALPTLIGSALAGRPSAVMGRASGIWNATFFLGQFLSPPVFIGITALAGDRSAAMAVFAVLVGVAALIATVLSVRRQMAGAAA